MNTFILEQGLLNDMHVYFQRPVQVANLTFCQFFNMYDYKYKLTQKRFLNNPGEFDEDGELRYIQIRATPTSKAFYIYKRNKPEDCITRLQGVPPDAGEIWYLRLLIREFPARSYQDLLTRENTSYTSFQEAAYEKGLLVDDAEAINTFQEARLFEPPSGLRFLFVLLTCQGFPTLQIFETLDMRQSMYADFLTNDTQAGVKYATQKLLEDLHDRFNRENKNMEDYGIPKPTSIQTELERERQIIGDMDSNIAWLHELMEQAPNTDEMVTAFDAITYDISHENTGIYFIRGCGGAGKTQFAKKVLKLASPTKPLVLKIFLFNTDYCIYKIQRKDS